MAKKMNDAGADAALDYWTAAERQVACSTEPATYAEVATYAIADVAVSGGDFTKANGDASGRKVTVAAKSGALIDTSGTVTHNVLVNDTASRLLYVTTTTSEALTANGSNTVNFPSWKITLNDPS